MPGINEAVEQIKQFWNSRTSTQKGLLLAGAVGTALLLGLFVRIIGAPDYKLLYTGLEAADAQALTARWTAKAFRIRPAQTARPSACLRISWMRRACRLPRKALHTAAGWALSCSTRRAGEKPSLTRKSRTSGRSKVNWSERSRRWKT